MSLGFNLVYKWHQPEELYGKPCKIAMVGKRDLAVIIFEDGTKITKSKYAVTSPAKFAESQNKKKPDTIPCPHCNGKGKLPKPQLPHIAESEPF